MRDYQKYINALRKCAKEHDNDRTSTGQIIVSDLCRDTANLLEEVEQEPIKGEWIKTNMESIQGWTIYECSNCKTWLSDLRPLDHKYCYNCGSDMRGKNEKYI